MFTISIILGKKFILIIRIIVMDNSQKSALVGGIIHRIYKCRKSRYSMNKAILTGILALPLLAKDFSVPFAVLHKETPSAADESFMERVINEYDFPDISLSDFGAGFLSDSKGIGMVDIVDRNENKRLDEIDTNPPKERDVFYRNSMALFYIPYGSTNLAELYPEGRIYYQLREYFGKNSLNEGSINIEEIPSNYLKKKFLGVSFFPAHLYAECREHSKSPVARTEFFEFAVAGRRQDLLKENKPLYRRMFTVIFDRPAP